MELQRLNACHDCLLRVTRRLERGTIRRTAFTAHHIPFPIASQIPTYCRQLTTQQQCKPRLQHRIRYATTTSAVTADKIDLSTLHDRVQELTLTVLEAKDSPVPPEQRILYVFEQIDAIARTLADANSVAGAISLSGTGSSATSALLGSLNSRGSRSFITKAMLLSTISQKAETIVRHPNVFITAAILKAYVQLQRLLHQPTSFPDIFELYANKPAPRANADGSVSFTQTNSRSLKTAIDQSTADTALAAAITAHDLSLALSIVDNSFATPSYARAKVVRQCAIPGAAATILPAVAYGVSSQFGTWQSMLDPSQATTIAFAGIMTYVAAVGSMGYVALTTSNDQMDRVSWAPGVPLWERWLREEERAALDRIASAWGFKSLEKRGDEQGEDWEILRETCGRRGTELDRVELMEGMQ